MKTPRAMKTAVETAWSIVGDDDALKTKAEGAGAIIAALESYARDYHEARLIASLGDDPPGVGEARRRHAAWAKMEASRGSAPGLSFVAELGRLLAAYDLLRDRLLLWARDEGVELALAQAREEGRREQHAKDVEAAKAAAGLLINGDVAVRAVEAAAVKV
jgi:hypothetical protein